MEAKVISCEKHLMDRIAELKVLKAQQEEVISAQFKELKDSLNIGTVLKESVAHIAHDKETRKNLVTLAATTGTTFLIERVIGSNNSIKRFFGSMLAEKVSNTFIGKLISKF
ncbi:hypothetical protein [Flavobacterium sp.]|uniref:hypothetical protein n=1 Tax=Flavobacterium sp. TaxID=239 RepID=UPI0025D8DAE8|nr:hypothetical protein [Flavobacterium sp.]